MLRALSWKSRKVGSWSCAKSRDYLDMSHECTHHHHHHLALFYVFVLCFIEFNHNHNDHDNKSTSSDMAYFDSFPSIREQHDDDDDDAVMAMALFLPTPIDTERIHVVPTVIPSKDLLCATERQHLQSWMNNLVQIQNTTRNTFIEADIIVSEDPTAEAVIVSSSSETSSLSEDLLDEDAEDQEQDRSAATSACSWNQRFRQLLDFRQQHGHVNVPYDFPPNPPLAQWVKRQRHQYRLLQEGRHSNLTPVRLEQLQAIDYCWDSREAHWLDRFYELEAFFQTQGHVRVSKRTSPSLAVWLKRQRHQGRIFLQGKVQGTNMTPARLQRLLQVGVKFAGGK